MKKKLLALALIAVMVFSITACGSSGPTTQDAQDCLKATLDLMLTGEYDESYEFSDMTREEAMQMREETFEEGFVDSFLESLDLGDIQISEDYLNGLAQNLLDYTNNGLKKVTYTIDSVTESENGFTGSVTFTPVKLYQVDDMDVEGVAMEYAQANMSKLQAMSEGEAQGELMKYVLDKMVEKLNADLENPANADPITAEILINKNDDGTIEVDDESLSTAMEDMMDAMIQ